MSGISFGARVSEDGAPEFDDPQRFSDHLKTLAGKRVEISVKRPRRGRTLSQNAYLWAVIYPEILAQRFYDRSDLTVEDVHEYCKLKFCPAIEKQLFEGETIQRRSTTLLSVEQMSEYTEKTMAHWASEYGVEFDR